MKKLFSKRNKAAMLKRGKLFIGYITAGYPQKDSFIPILKKCENEGVDIFEVGYPSLNPFADGEIIRNAQKSVDCSIRTDIEYWKQLRSEIDGPIWVMGYSADLIGTGNYLKIAEAGVADAFVIPDINIDETIKLGEELSKYEIDMVYFVKNGEPELEKYFEHSSLIYYQLINGPTGSKTTQSDDFSVFLNQSKQYDDIYVFGGFGINSGERAVKLLNSGFDGTIVGTAMISHLNESEESLLSFISDIHSAITESSHA
ncbi:tryptophan synthase subunit alpha [Tepidibacter mesophilus]|uniref:tryptophan synthase subunit alpha n=1 Tax=Tepidibacter mesophilus TaxID=655607 RepID=UPI001650E4C0|nr:tryptophan synthase subunit alpha [Tepidibacter mesophilus]